MEGRVRCGMCFYLFFFLPVVIASLQLKEESKELNNCNCIDLCQENFTVNSISDDGTKEACQRGCRFYLLAFHTSDNVNPTVDYAHIKEGCLISCSESYVNPAELSACSSGCTAVTSKKSCDTVEHQLPHFTYTLLIEESDILIHPGEPDPDDVLIDPGLRKQFEKTLESLLDTKPKLPEIHFKNLPIMNAEVSRDHLRSSFRCPKFYGFDSKFEFRNGKITTSDLFSLFSVLIFAMICFIVSRNLEKQRKLWKRILMSMVQNKHFVMKIPENSMAEELLLKVDYPQKYELNDPNPINQSMENASDPTDPDFVDSKFQEVSLFFPEDDTDADRQIKSMATDYNGPSLLKI